MKKFVLLVATLLLLCVGVKAQQLDQYGGRTDVACAQATGWFHTEKIGNRWWFCNPLGHGYFFHGVGAWVTPNIPKYNNDTQLAAASLITEFTSWGFNGVGELSYGAIEPGSCATCKKLPQIQTITVSNYAGVNLWNYAARPMKNMMWGMNQNYTGWRASIMDFFEPQFDVWLGNFFKTDQTVKNYALNPYFAGMMLDDTDWFWGMAAGPEFHTVLPGHNSGDPGYIVLNTSPVQTFNPDPASRSIPETYSDTKVYSKVAMANPPATCSVQTPCSLRDFLFKRYNGSITALNLDWGSNYTSFDSTGTPVQGVLIATGDGNTQSFSFQLPSVPISPLSVLLKIDGVAQGGDCPGFQVCNIGNVNQGTFGGAAGTPIMVGEQAWNSDIHFTDASGYPQAAFHSVLVYHYPTGVNEVGTPSRMVGERSQSSQQPFVIGPGPDVEGLASGYDVYMYCDMNQGVAPTFGCVAAGLTGTLTLQASNVPIGVNWSVPVTGITTSGSTIPASPSFIDYTTGQGKITFKNKLALGSKVTLDYVQNGWMFGSGVMDEDGRHKQWVGTNSICLLPAGSCDGVDNPLPNANPHMGAALDAWVAQFAGQYFATMRKNLKAAAPNMLYLGPDTAGGWGRPPRKEILQAAALYVDALFTNWFANQPDAATDAQVFQFTTQNFGDKPMINFLTLSASPDSAESDYDDYLCCFHEMTQEERGLQWYTIANTELNMLSANGTYQWIGDVLWGSQDFNGTNGEHNNWGVKTPTDNAYDGHEAVMATGPCSIPLQTYKCGGEKANYGDVITQMSAGNLLWLLINPTPVPPPVSAPVSVAVSPATASINTSATVQFTATVTCSDGTTTCGGVSWSASAGSVTQTGLYTAPSVAGPATVTATSTAPAVLGTAQVTATAPPPVSGSQLSITAPAGVTVSLQPADGNGATSGFNYFLVALQSYKLNIVVPPAPTPFPFTIILHTPASTRKNQSFTGTCKIISVSSQTCTWQ